LTLIEDPNDPLYDVRVKLGPAEGLVRDIAHRGVIEPVVITKRGDKAVVVDGRQRVAAAREANKRLSDMGKAPIKVPCIVRRGEDADLFGVLIAANEHRLDDTPLERAKKAQRLINMGRSIDEAAIAFGVSGGAVRHWLKLLDLPAAARKAIESGVMSADTALTLSEADPEDAKAIVEQATVAAKEAVKGRRSVRSAVRKVVKGAKGPKMKSRRQIESRLAEKRLPPDYRIALLWVLGKEADEA
jgi:ParB family chromosome partitioning protein